MSRRQNSERRRPNPHADLDTKVTVNNEDSLFEIIEKLTTPALLLILDGVQDPHNLGACLRTAEAAGANAVVVPKDRSVGLTDIVRTVACGAAERLPLVTVTNLARTLRELTQSGIWLVGTSDRAEKSIYDLDLTLSLAIVMGSEGKGLRRLTAEHCDYLARIPMIGSVESLNVSVATGVSLFEAVRQRSLKT